MYKLVNSNELAQLIRLIHLSTKESYAHINFVHVFVAMLLPSKIKLHSMLHKL